ncbi:branched-chain amino acid ABC transporter permease [Candidatus Solincola tengchongensis]|uniref:branched-chain amino acid ABC transporter permease n=1 Tax=Candidatus Solincola tengchongensis TaxID=2900693 RepID=UPI00257C788A|nr:branched-chain amino acid ABC transporter permease [Candidatus Solincola tengchongensis]
MLDFFRNCPQYLANGMANGCLYILVAMGFNIIYTSTGIINFAQGEFSMFGGLFAYALAVSAGLPIPLAAVLAVLATAAIGGAMERVMIYPLRRAGVLTAIIATIGASIFFKSLGRVFWPSEAYKVPEFTPGTFRLPGATVSRQFLWVVGLTVTCVVLLYFFFNRTKAGRAMRACSVNRQAATLVGINVSRMSLYSFILAAALGGAAGLISSPYASYGMGLEMGVKGFTASVVGGLGNTFGAVVGGLVLGLLEELIPGFLTVVLGVSTGYKGAVAAVLLIVVLLFRPQGLLGRGMVEKV